MKINFSLKRVLLLIKAILVENQRSILISSVITTLVIVFISFTVSVNTLGNKSFSTNMSIEVSTDTYSENTNMVATATMGVVFVVLLVVVCGSKLFTLFISSVKKRRQPYKYALPANVSEKYVSNLIVAFVVTPVIVSLLYIVAIFKTNILLLILSTTDFQFDIMPIAEIIASNLGLDSFFEIFSIYGLVLIGIIFGAGIKSKLLTLILIIATTIAVFSIDTVHEWFGAGYIYADIIILLAIWTGTYISFKRKELRN